MSRCGFFVSVWVSVLVLVIVSTGRAEDRPDARQLARTIDMRLAQVWRDASVTPASIVDDATFLRRVTLDLVGRIPTVTEAQAFLASQDARKREHVIDQLTGSAAHAQHMATFFRRAWLPQTDIEPYDHLGPETDDWIEAQLWNRVPYDEIVRRLITVRLGSEVPGGRMPSPSADRNQQSQSPWRNEQTKTPETFVRANGYQPESLAANATRAFLGINLECAQCHDHPFARWSRDQFWQTAAFFAPRRLRGDNSLPRITIPDSDRSLEPELLTGEEIEWPDTVAGNTVADNTGREVFASWLTNAKNPYFARNLVNHLWANFFGAGLIEPLDDLTGGGESIDDELLDMLARSFVDSGFDVRLIVKAIVLSDAYQREASAPKSMTANSSNGILNLSSELDVDLFARARVRAMTGEQLFDSVRTAMGLELLLEDLDSAADLRTRSEFAATFQIGRPATAERSILQSLALMNGELASRLALPDSIPLVVAVADAPFLSHDDRLKAMFLAALGRAPDGEELESLKQYVSERQAAGDSTRQALADVLWAVINSVEFNTIH